MTISDIAKLANVSISSVSIVLNNKPGVSEKTRKLVLDTIEKYNYKPNQLAKSLAAKESKTIGLVIKEIDNPYSSKVMKGVFDKASELGYSVLLGSSELLDDRESEIINALLSKQVDGLIISPLQRKDNNLKSIFDLINQNIPLVILRRLTDIITNTVDINNFKAAYDAVKYLIDLGHKRIAYVAGPDHSGHAIKRMEGYKQALLENNIQLEEDYIYTGDPYAVNGAEAARKILKANVELPTAVFCYNDLVAMGALNYFLDKGINVPKDISIIGFDNIEFCDYLKVPLTTVEMPAYQIGNEAAGLLINQIANREDSLNKNVILEHRIIERESCSQVNK